MFHSSPKLAGPSPWIKLDKQSNMALIHSLEINGDIKVEVKTGIFAGQSELYSEFMGIKIDTGTNRRSIMSANQYCTYCVTFYIPSAIRPSDGRWVNGIGVDRRSAGTVKIQVPFRAGLTVRCKRVF